MADTDEYTAHFSAMPEGVHPSLVHRLARFYDLPVGSLGRSAEVPAALRGPNYPED